MNIKKIKINQFEINNTFHNYYEGDIRKIKNQEKNFKKFIRFI